MPHPQFSIAQIRRFAKIFDDGATHDELTDLYGVDVADSQSPRQSKEKRLRAHLMAAQKRDGNGDEVVRLIEAFFHPAQFIDSEEPPEDLLNIVSALLFHSQLCLNQSGKVIPLADAPVPAHEHPHLRQELADMLARMTSLEREGKVTQEQVDTLRAKVVELEKNLSKVSQSSWRDQLLGALIASGVGVLVNRENLLYLLQAVQPTLGYHPSF